MPPFYPLAVQATVTELDRASSFLEGVAGLPIRTRSEHAIDLDNGTLVVRLVRGDHNTKLSLVLLAPDLGEAARTLLADERVVTLRNEDWVSPARKELTLGYDGWLELILARDYDEDELGVCPDLPADLEWDPPATSLLQSLIARIPIPYRESARLKSTRSAEALTLEKGEVIVQPFEAVRGLVQTTPVFQHESLWRALCEAGQEPERWAPELVKDFRLA